MTPTNPADLSGREFFARVIKETVTDVLWYGIGTLIITLLGQLSWWLGVILAGAFVVIVVAQTIHTFIGAILGLVLIPMMIYEKIQGRYVDVGEQVYLVLANILQVLVTVFLIGCGFWLYRVFF